MLHPFIVYTYCRVPQSQNGLNTSCIMQNISMNTFGIVFDTTQLTEISYLLQMIIELIFVSNANTIIRKLTGSRQ